MNRLISEDGQLYACGNALCSDGDIECANCRYANEAFLKLAAYEDTGLEPEQIKQLNDAFKNSQKKLEKAFDELLKYKDLEEQGLLIKLPCKLGSPIFEICTHAGWYAMDIPTSYSIEERKFNYEYINDIGKTVFLTREEAEKALEVENE
jgi:hypothetical protein